MLQQVCDYDPTSIFLGVGRVYEPGTFAVDDRWLSVIGGMSHCIYDTLRRKVSQRMCFWDEFRTKSDPSTWYTSAITVNFIYVVCNCAMFRPNCVSEKGFCYRRFSWDGSKVLRRFLRIFIVGFHGFIRLSTDSIAILWIWVRVFFIVIVPTTWRTYVAPGKEWYRRIRRS